MLLRLVDEVFVSLACCWILSSCVMLIVQLILLILDQNQKHASVSDHVVLSFLTSTCTASTHDAMDEMQLLLSRRWLVAQISCPPRLEKENTCEQQAKMPLSQEVLVAVYALEACKPIGRTPRHPKRYLNVIDE